MSDVLSQNEIDNLLSALSTEEVDVSNMKPRVYSKMQQIDELSKDPNIVLAYVTGWNDALKKVGDILYG